LEVSNYLEMSEKTNESSGTTAATTSIVDAFRNNAIRMVEEVAKANPQYMQAVSNLQADYLETTKNAARTAFEAQRQIAQNLNLPAYPLISDAIAKQSTELTNNFTRTIGIYNQLTINAIDAARTNARIFGGSADAATDFTTNLLKTWTGYWTAQQQQFTKAY
jgi:hypothetical protein